MYYNFHIQKTTTSFAFLYETRFLHLGSKSPLKGPPPRIPMYEHTPAAGLEKTNMRARMCAFRKHTLHASATGRRDRV